MKENGKRKIMDILPELRWETMAPPYLRYNYFQGSKLHPLRYDANVFDLVNAWWLIEASTLAYSEEEFAREKFVQAGLTEVKFFSGSGTQCYVTSNEDFVIVAFRGTEIRLRKGRTDFQNIVADIMTDSDILLVPSGQGGKVHEGFKKALDEVWEERGLRQYICSKDNGHRTIWFTGHSLGAALATLAADRYGNVRGLYTFGSPRVGDEPFKNDFYINTYRIVNNNDIVARVPPEGLYRHVGNLKYIDENGILHDNPSRWETLTHGILGRISHIFNSLGQIRSGFASLVPDDIVDHIPLLYATHLWNNIP
jgi:triacylglycerol lipase